MSAVHESLLGIAWLDALLRNDGTLMTLAPGGLYRALAKATATPPWIIYNQQSSRDIVTMSAARVMTEQLFQVKAVGPSSKMAAVGAVASRFDVLLKKTSGTTTNGVILCCYRESSLQLDELINGELWTNIGGLYRLTVQQA